MSCQVFRDTNTRFQEFPVFVIYHTGVFDSILENFSIAHHENFKNRKKFKVLRASPTSERLNYHPQICAVFRVFPLENRPFIIKNTEYLILNTKFKKK